MARRFKGRKGSSAVEYTALIVVVIAVFALMMQYFFKGNMGRWKEAGDAIGFGRQYDPAGTLEFLCENGTNCQQVP